MYGYITKTDLKSVISLPFPYEGLQRKKDPTPRFSLPILLDLGLNPTPSLQISLLKTDAMRLHVWLGGDLLEDRGRLNEKT